jgi:hypothetical protein
MKTDLHPYNAYANNRNRRYKEMLMERFFCKPVPCDKSFFPAVTFSSSFSFLISVED